jgi:hypothetical protein
VDLPGQLREVDRLPEQRNVAIAGEQLACLRVVGASHEHHGQPRIEVARPLGELAAVHPGHPEIREQDAGLARVRSEEPEGRPAAGAAPDLAADLVEHAGDGGARRRLVVDHQDQRTGSHRQDVGVVVKHGASGRPPGRRSALSTKRAGR